MIDDTYYVLYTIYTILYIHFKESVTINTSKPKHVNKQCLIYDQLTIQRNYDTERSALNWGMVNITSSSTMK